VLGRKIFLKLRRRTRVERQSQRGLPVTAPTPKEIAKRFTAYYQPIVDLNTGAVAGFEALARVVESDGSVKTAGAVIENIERRSDTLKALIRTILAAIRRDMVPLFHRHQHFYVSVNIPPVILGRGQVLPIIEELGLTPYLSRIACEVTERQALTSVGRTALERAQQAGMSVAIDDFGTGHSGLMQIVGLDFDILKIDHSLIETVLTNQTAARMLRGIVALAAALRLRTVAEGVETGDEAFFLRAAGVDCGQGWFWSRAVSASEASRILSEGYPLANAQKSASKKS
jgi:sensor c-di-GMP phosphodiesterase-like protein